MIKIFYFISLFLILFVDVQGQQDTIIYDQSTGNYIIQYVGESLTGADTLITLTYIPWTKINPSIKCEIIYDIDSSEYIYNWIIENGEDSEQNLNRFIIVFSENAQVADRSTSGWYSKRWKGWKNGERTFLNKWGWTGDQGLEPSWSVGGFKLGSPDLPSIGFAYFQGKGGSIPRFPYSLPPEKIYTQFNKLDAFPGSYVQRETVVPGELPLPFVIYNFLDTLVNYTNQSRNLDWILNDNTADKYTNFFTTAEDQIIQGDSSAARTTLENVLQEVDIDSTDNLTSEAYALLRYNTEYLINQIPEGSTGLPVKQ
jgi:hypothetical protein